MYHITIDNLFPGCSSIQYSYDATETDNNNVINTTVYPAEGCLYYIISVQSENAVSQSNMTKNITLGRCVCCVCVCVCVCVCHHSIALSLIFQICKNFMSLSI